MINNKSGLGSVVKKLRSGLKLTQSELGQRAGLSKTFISNFENGKKGISFDKLNAVAEALGVHKTILFVLSTTPDRNSEHLSDRFLCTIHQIAEEAVKLHVSTRTSGGKELK